MTQEPCTLETLLEEPEQYRALLTQAGCGLAVTLPSGDVVLVWNDADLQELLAALQVRDFLADVAADLERGNARSTELARRLRAQIEQGPLLP